MRLGRLFIMLALVLVVGVLAIFVAIRFFAQPAGGEEPAQSTEQVAMTDIVIVVQPIPRGATINQDALSTIAYPRDQTIEGMFTDPAQVVGYRARFDLEPGVPLTQNMVVASLEGVSETGSDAALLIPRGMVAISIPVDRLSSVAYGLRTGDHVNIMASMLFVDLDTTYQTILPNDTAGVVNPGSTLISDGSVIINDLLSLLTAQVSSGGAVSPQGRTELEPVLGVPLYVVPSESKQRPRLVTQTIVQDAIVLHVGTFSLEDIQPTPEPTPVVEGATPAPQVTTVQPPSPPDVITLIVFPQDAIALEYLLLSGARINLAMRPSGDDTRVLTEAVTLQFLLDQYNIPVPSQLPYGVEPRVDDLVPPTLIDANDIVE